MATNIPDYPHRQLYKHYNVADGYNIDPGVMILPLAVDEPTDPVERAAFVPFEVVRAHAPIMYRTTPFDAVKDNAPPKVPQPADTGAFVFLSGDLLFQGGRLSTDGLNSTWEVGGEYAFAMAGSVSLALETGLVKQSRPIPTEVGKYLQSQYAGGQGPGDLVIANAGNDVKSGYVESLSVSFTGSSYTYWSTSFFPGKFFDSTMLNGQTNIPG
jgi:hypothetical protein